MCQTKYENYIEMRKRKKQYFSQRGNTFAVGSMTQYIHQIACIHIVIHQQK